MKKPSLKSLIIAASVLVPSSALAGISIRYVMSRWNYERRQVERMLSGQSQYDSAAIAHAIHLYVSDANRVAGELNTNSAAAQAFAKRFRRFARDAQAAGAVRSREASFRPRFRHLISECRACHASLN